MSIVARYRQYAANCLKVAKEISDPSVRSSLVDMAQVWMTLAEQTEGTPPPRFLTPRQPHSAEDQA
jgi:hypothetical protein